ncbi:hypothetical protein D3C86_1862130 [compost metagenome]
MFDFITTQFTAIGLGAEHVAWLFVHQLCHTDANGHTGGILISLGDEAAPLLLQLVRGGLLDYLVWILETNVDFDLVLFTGCFVGHFRLLEAMKRQLFNQRFLHNHSIDKKKKVPARSPEGPLWIRQTFV